MAQSTVEFLRSSLQAFEDFAKGSRPGDIYAAHQWEMAGAHAFLINALLHIYETAPSIEADKEKDFVAYALQWYAALNHHHEWEETLYYPLFNPKFKTDSIVAEHESFRKGIEDLKDYLVSCLPAGAPWGYSQKAPQQQPKKFDAGQLRSLIDAFAHVLTTHLLQEINYIAPDKLRASGLTEAELKHISEVSDKHMRSMPSTTFLVYTVTHTPKSSGFPPAPSFIKNILVPYVLYFPNRRLWQFAPKSWILFFFTGHDVYICLLVS